MTKAELAHIISCLVGGDNPDTIRSAFQKFDPEATGFVKEDELRHQLTRFGQKLTEDELDSALAEARLDTKGRFNIDSYVRLITGSSKDED